jgi:Fur family transcriptional regulator, ferric uptake regulator
MAHSIDELLEHHQLRRTKIRIKMLSIFLDKDYALAHAELEASIGQDFDRVTIYRTLKSFEEQGLVHRVLDESGSAKYALCQHEHNEIHKHHDQHIHFNCVTCGHTYCLDNVPIPEIKLPAAYQLQKLEFLAQGICQKCSTI